MNDLGQLIQDTQNSNNQTRKAAEQKLRDYRDQDPGLFALRCSEEFKNNQLPEYIRPSAGILIKYTLFNAPTGPDVIWKSFSPDVKQQIKANLLEISEPNDFIRNITSDLIAMIYLIELPWNGWPTLFPVLIQNLNCQNEDLKKSSILLLDKICDQAKNRKISLNQDTVNLILEVLIHFIRENGTDEYLKTPVLSTIESSLTFFKEIFETQSVIRNEVLTFLLKEARSNIRSTQFRAMQCLIKFITISTHYLKECWHYIWEATSAQIAERTPESAILAIEIWQTIIQEEKHKLPQDQILHEVSQRLVPALLENFLDEQKSQDDEEMGQDGELTIFSATKTCLISLAQAMNETFFESAMAFIQKHLWSENQIEKRAGLIVYSCILDCPKPQFLAAFITQALLSVADILFNSDNSEILKLDASLAFQRTFEVLPELFLHGDLLNSRMQDLINAIKTPSKISTNIANFWKNFGQFAAENNKDFSLGFPEAIGNLIDNVFQKLYYEDYELIEPSLLAAGTLISCLLKQEVKVEYINSIREKIKEQQGDWNQQRIQMTQAGFLSCIKIVLQKCQLSLEDPLVKDVFSLLDGISETQGRIPGEGISALEGLISAVGPESTAIYFEKMWTWIIKSFSLMEDPKGLTASLKAILKMAKTCPEQVKNALGDIFTNLVTVMNNTDYEDDVKAEIIEFVGDLAEIFKGEILASLEDITQIYNAGIELITSNPVLNGTLGVEDLKESLVRSYKIFFKAVGESENSHLILHSVSKMMQYLMTTCSKDWNPTIDYIREALDLVFEIALRFKDQGTENVKSDVVVSLVEKLSQFPEDPRNIEIIDSAKKVFNYL